MPHYDTRKAGKSSVGARLAVPSHVGRGEPRPYEARHNRFIFNSGSGYFQGRAQNDHTQRFFSALLGNFLRRDLKPCHIFLPAGVFIA